MPVNKSANLQSLSRAIEVLEVCHGMKLTVPDDIVLLSVDNDEMLCNSASPRLSSLATSVRGCGFDNTNYLKILFRRHCGQTMSEYRKSFSRVSYENNCQRMV